VNSVQYDVTTVVGTYPSLSSTLQNQVWYGNPSLADDFAYAVGGQLGFPIFSNFSLGPFFAFEVTDTTLRGAAVYDIVLGSVHTVVFEVTGALTTPYTFATIQQVSTVPDVGTTAVMLGLAMAGMMSLRRRFV
jgi:hypothetical protein